MVIMTEKQQKRLIKAGIRRAGQTKIGKNVKHAHERAEKALNNKKVQDAIRLAKAAAATETGKKAITAAKSRAPVDLQAAYHKATSFYNKAREYM